MESLLRQLKTLRNTRPDPRFMARSRQELLRAPHHGSAGRFYYSQIKWRFFEGLSFSVAVGLAALLVYLSAGLISRGVQTKVAQDEPRPNFSISLEEAEYYKEVAPNIFVVVLGDKK